MDEPKPTMPVPADAPLTPEHPTVPVETPKPEAPATPAPEVPVAPTEPPTGTGTPPVTA